MLYVSQIWGFASRKHRKCDVLGSLCQYLFLYIIRLRKLYMKFTINNEVSGISFPAMF